MQLNEVLTTQRRRRAQPLRPGVRVRVRDAGEKAVSPGVQRHVAGAELGTADVQAVERCSRHHADTPVRRHAG